VFNVHNRTVTIINKLGLEITLIANGNDEKAAIDGLTELIQQRFGESE
jgi:phosphotransferase system HPr-like phosphotransfer protein